MSGKRQRATEMRLAGKVFTAREIRAGQKKNKACGEYLLPAIRDDQVEWIPVTEDIYKEYLRDLDRDEKQDQRDHVYQMTKQEREMSEEQRLRLDRNQWPRCVSLDAILEGGGEEYLPVTSGLDDLVADALDLQEFRRKLTLLLPDLSEEEKQILIFFFVQDKSEREYERCYGVNRKTIHYRKEKLLRKIEKFIFPPHKVLSGMSEGHPSNQNS